MPIYEYKCSLCNNIETKLRKINDVPEHVPCARCGSDAYRCLSAPTSFTFKGVPFSASSQKTA